MSKHLIIKIYGFLFLLNVSGEGRGGGFNEFTVSCHHFVFLHPDLDRSQGGETLRLPGARWVESLGPSIEVGGWGVPGLPAGPRRSRVWARGGHDAYTSERCEPDGRKGRGDGRRPSGVWTAGGGVAPLGRGLAPPDRAGALGRVGRRRGRVYRRRPPRGRGRTRVAPRAPGSLGSSVLPRHRCAHPPPPLRRPPFSSSRRAERRSRPPRSSPLRSSPGRRRRIGAPSPADGRSSSCSGPTGRTTFTL